MKRTIIFFFFLSIINCYNQYEHRDHNRTKAAREIVILSTILNGCKYGSSNSLFPTYYDKYIADTKQYSKLILGDSTMDITVNSFPGYYDKNTTGAFPVSGNKFENFQEQLCVINSKNPLVIFTSTFGGNNLLAQQSDDVIIQNGKNYIDALESKFPSATKVGALVHLTRNSYANQHRTTTNSALKIYAENKNWKIINPDNCITADATGFASQQFLLDSIHPNSDSSFCIKNIALNLYNITW